MDIRFRRLVEGVARDYGSASTDPAEFFIASVDDRDVGWIQCYAVADYPDEAEVQHWWALGCASPVAANVASWRALEKAGFAFAGSFDDRFGPCRLMAAHRADWPTSDLSRPVV
jgi:hypothetical protein